MKDLSFPDFVKNFICIDDAESAKWDSYHVQYCVTRDNSKNRCIN
jgi:hypothetical protein